jgi:integrase
VVAHRTAQESERAAWGSDYQDHGLCFAREDGEPLRPDWITKRHGELVTAAGLPRIVLHEMRHGAVSLLLAAGRSIDQVALIISHGSEAVTREVYAHTPCARRRVLPRRQPPRSFVPTTVHIRCTVSRRRMATVTGVMPRRRRSAAC